jgi:hypothetical protein
MEFQFVADKLLSPVDIFFTHGNRSSVCGIIRSLKRLAGNPVSELSTHNRSNKTLSMRVELMQQNRGNWGCPKGCF